MATPLNQRAHHLFLSHSSRDKGGFVDNLYQWLTRKCGVKVWYDRGLVSGQISSNIDDAIDTCRSAVLVFSKNSVQSHWVELECSRIQEEAARYSDFRIATIRLDDVQPPGLLKSFKHIDVKEGELTTDSAALLIETLFGGRDSGAGRSVYFSRGWKQAERPLADQVSEALQSFGLRLFCDWTDQPHYDSARVRNIVDGTGGLAAILPHRGSGTTSTFIVKEIQLARTLGLPVLVFVQSGVVVRPEWSLVEALQFESGDEVLTAAEIAERYATRIEEFAESWKKPARGEHVFLGHSLEESIDDNFLTARRMISRITGLPVEVGSLVAGSDAQDEIVRLIQDAELCIIDITNVTYKDLPDKIDFALNSCIEAGIALGCGRHLYLTCRGPRRTPPFMFRNKQVWFYDDGLHLIGNLRQIGALHRRMVL